MKQILRTIQTRVSQDAPFLLAGSAIAGVVTTAYLAARGGMKARKRLDMLTVDAPLKIEIRETWDCYIPAVVSGACTITCIIAGTKVSNKRTAAAQAAFLVTERAYAEYRNQVIDEYGARRDEAIRDNVAANRVRTDPPPSTLIAGSGKVVCLELHTGRYFESDMETLRRAANNINARLLNHDFATLDDLYDEIGMHPTATSGALGWTSPKLLSLEFTSVLDDVGRPCLAFGYNYVKPLKGKLHE